jgi:hypothetical protein
MSTVKRDKKVAARKKDMRRTGIKRAPSMDKRTVHMLMMNSSFGGVRSSRVKK